MKMEFDENGMIKLPPKLQEIKEKNKKLFEEGKAIKIKKGFSNLSRGNFMSDTELTRQEAIEFLGISDKEFDNYFKKSEEIKGRKDGARWAFDSKSLDAWNKLRKDRTVVLSLKEYEECFEFAIKMVYSSKAMGGSIRGARSEMQAADDWILGILAEHGLMVGRIKVLTGIQ